MGTITEYDMKRRMGFSTIEYADFFENMSGPVYLSVLHVNQKSRWSTLNVTDIYISAHLDFPQSQAADMMYLRRSIIESLRNMGDRKRFSFTGESIILYDNGICNMVDDLDIESCYMDCSNAWGKTLATRLC